MSYEPRKFIIKYDYLTPFTANTVVSLITIINETVLVENVYGENKIRAWVMRYEIYPLGETDVYGHWEFNKDFDNIIKKLNLK